MEESIPFPTAGGWSVYTVMLLSDEAVDYFACLVCRSALRGTEAGQAGRTHCEVSEAVVGRGDLIHYLCSYDPS